MIEYILAWPFGLSETLGLVAFLGAVVGFLWRLAYRVTVKLDDLTDAVASVARSGNERGDEHARQMVDLGGRVSSLELNLGSRAAAETSLVAGQERLEKQVGNLVSRLDAFMMSAISHRKD